jgi:hypothetical protein
MKKLQKLSRRIRAAYHNLQARAYLRAARAARQNSMDWFSKSSDAQQRFRALTAWNAARDLEEVARDHMNRAEFLSRPTWN